MRRTRRSKRGGINNVIAIPTTDLEPWQRLIAPKGRPQEITFDFDKTQQPAERLGKPSHRRRP